MIFIGAAEILLIAFIAIGGLLLMMRIVQSQRGGKPSAATSSANEAGGSRVDYDSIRQRVERRWKRRSEFATHAAIYAFAGIGFVLTSFPATLPVLLAWGAVLFIHLLQVFFAEARERAIEQEIEKERQRTASYPPERTRTVHLSDEGELLDVVDDDWEANEKQKRG
ncbi:MAG TPA: 2TM domain-containing protein [Phototrophicaceae bacterium]|nr:2TM domain-containing protein [Phototrophicaceae bacterium]